jgi:hypothetical protein
MILMKSDVLIVYQEFVKLRMPFLLLQRILEALFYILGHIRRICRVCIVTYVAR